MTAEKIEKHLLNATQALAKKDYLTAKDEYIRLLKLDKKNLEALKGLTRLGDG